MKDTIKELDVVALLAREVLLSYLEIRPLMCKRIANAPEQSPPLTVDFQGMENTSEPFGAPEKL